MKTKATGSKQRSYSQIKTIQQGKTSSSGNRLPEVTVTDGQWQSMMTATGRLAERPLLRMNGVLVGGSTEVSEALVVDRSFKFKRIWNAVVPPRVKFFIWTSFHNRVPTLQFLSQRKIVPVDAGCIVCGMEESQSHLFLHCEFASAVWYKVLRKVGLSWVIPKEFDDFLLHWIHLIPHGKYANLWQSLWFFLIWEIWKARNMKIFQQKQTS
ncbi:uncharacterized protein LOC130015260 [Mercurialis annua]|uniref:uncharacterized protein LOC130015260 n=1 Tax=Mercurialis annua TaxID=3986 RepID=UPI0024ACA390|nr:uncharacterized protein LOC130015260 [Mercurialis annua]